MDSLFKALADPTRRRLLDLLAARNGQSLRDLCAGAAMSRQAISQHLDQLEAAGLIAVLWQGREKRHYLNPAPLFDIAERWIDSFEPRRLRALRDLKRRLEREPQEDPMALPAFVYMTYIATTPERLWAALTEGEFTRQYWFERRIESSWQPGAPVRFYDGASDTLTDEGVVLIAEPPRSLSYTFRYGGQPAAEPSSRVTFTIEAGDGQVKLTLVHDQIPDEAAAAGWREGWTPILSSLKTFLESGRSLPPWRGAAETEPATAAAGS